MKKLISVIMILIMFSFCLAGCGGTNSGDGTSSGDTSYEEQTYDSSQEGAVKARVEMDDYQIHLDAAEDTTISGAINHSYGQDMVATNEDGDEIARITLEGKDGDEEHFNMVIPASALKTGHNPVHVRGAELPDKVLETNSKTVSINIGKTE